MVVLSIEIDLSLTTLGRCIPWSTIPKSWDSSINCAHSEPEVFMIFFLHDRVSGSISSHSIQGDDQGQKKKGNLVENNWDRISEKRERS